MKKFTGYPKDCTESRDKLFYLNQIGIITTEQCQKSRFFLAMSKGINKYGFEGAVAKLNVAINEVTIK